MVSVLAASSLSKSDTRDGQIDITFTTSKLSDVLLSDAMLPAKFFKLFDHNAHLEDFTIAADPYIFNGTGNPIRFQKA